MEAAAINKTPNLNLQKPTSDELYSVQVQNTNMDILDATIKTMQNTDGTLAKQADLETHINNKNNPHTVTKEQIGLSNVVNQRQIPAIPDAVTDNGVPLFDGNGYKLKDSGFTIGKSVPVDAIFTDTVYTHPTSGVISGTYKSVTVNETGHVVSGSNPTTLSEYGIIDAEPLGSADNALVEAKEYADDTYTQATGYTDTKISDLINGAPSTLDTLNEIADAMEENQTVVVALETAVGSKANDVEFQAHKNNETIHVTASQIEKWDNAIYSEDIMTPTINGIGKPDNVTIGVSGGQFYTKFKNYTSLADIGLTAPVTCLEVATAMADNSRITLLGWGNNVVTDTPEKWGMVTFEKYNNAFAEARYTVVLSAVADIRQYIRYIYVNTDVISDWAECLTSKKLTANLLATTTGTALDATMGKVLDDKINSIPVVEIVDDLVTDDSEKALSAKQGKELKSLIDNVGSGGSSGLEILSFTGEQLKFIQKPANGYAESSPYDTTGITINSGIISTLWVMLVPYEGMKMPLFVRKAITTGFTAPIVGATAIVDYGVIKSQYGSSGVDTVYCGIELKNNASESRIVTKSNIILEVLFQ